MKRQSGNPRKGAAAPEPATKKKAKAEEAAEEAAEERREVEASIEAAEEMAEWAGFWSGVDEETAWAPFWEVEAYEALYGDVLWDYDIWDLQALRTAPNP